jgi:hypothetical protein
MALVGDWFKDMRREQDVAGVEFRDQFVERTIHFDVRIQIQEAIDLIVFPEIVDRKRFDGGVQFEDGVLEMHPWTFGNRQVLGENDRERFIVELEVIVDRIYQNDKSPV